jgi:hypothetical protein
VKKKREKKKRKKKKEKKAQTGHCIVLPLGLAHLQAATKRSEDGKEPRCTRERREQKKKEKRKKKKIRANVQASFHLLLHSHNKLILKRSALCREAGGKNAKQGQDKHFFSFFPFFFFNSSITCPEERQQYLAALPFSS